MPRSQRVDRIKLIEASFMLLEDGGLGGLTMRRLARHLGVSAASLYWHVSDKSDLLTLMQESMLKQASDNANQAADWHGWLYQFGSALYDLASGTPKAAQIFFRSSPRVAEEPSRAKPPSAQLTRFGLDVRTAVRFEAWVIAFAVGCAVRDQGQFGSPLDGDDTSPSFGFVEGLRALLAGAEQDLGASQYVRQGGELKISAHGI